MTLIVGQTIHTHGSVTKLKAIGAREPSLVEQSLGYHEGRLARGYWILLFTGHLGPADFELDGNTMRSGGRAGQPALTQREDALRERVHDQIVKEHGTAGYINLQKYGLSGVTERGPDRLAKVRPVIEHMKHGSPAKQYPMGGGGLQWRLKVDKPFLVAAFVNAQGLATAPGLTARLDAKAPSDDRARLARYLEAAG